VGQRFLGRLRHVCSSDLGQQRLDLRDAFRRDHTELRRMPT
jgi:hypothetical protein